MGTSSIYNGPKDKNPLLPDDFDDTLKNQGENNPNNEQEQQEESKKEIPNGMPWQAVKKAMSQYITGSSSNYKNVIRGYVKASGGSSNITQNSRPGINSAIRLGNVLSSIRKDGIFKTLESLHIELDGKDVTELLSELVNCISFSSNTKEDSVAKNATIEALSDIYEYIEKNDMEISCLDSIDQNLIDVTICNYISSYIWGKMLKDLQSRFEKYSNDSQKTIEIEKEFKLYIKNTVEIEMKKASSITNNFLNHGIGEDVINLYTRCYDVLEGAV